MSERVTKSIRLSGEEWAAVRAAAGPVAPATWMREAVLAAARGGAPAALVERESGRGGVDGSAAAGSGVARGASDGSASSPAVPPVESAGSASAGFLPSAGAPAAPDPSSSAGSAPASRGRRLVEVIEEGLAETRGRRADDRALALQMVEGGKVVVDGLVAIDPDVLLFGGEEIEVR